MTQPGKDTDRSPVPADRTTRSLTARSVLASALLGEDPPDLPVAHLIRLASLFGINENRARVALSRMVAAGEATTDGAGRYRLAGHLLGRQRRQLASRGGSTGPWRGDWTLVVVTSAGQPAEVRTARRRALAYARLAELREGVWLRPANLEVVVAEAVAPDVVRLSARPADPAALAGRLWPLEQWAARARALADALAARPPRDFSDLAPGFELSAAVLRHLQADPLLPPALLPAGWPGRRLRTLYDAWDGRYRTLLVDWSRQVGGG
jgi:phenylacetic acid degradation operon negative regulatory protein